MLRIPRPRCAARAGGGGRALADGNQVPVLALGVWQVPNGGECVNAVRWARGLIVMTKSTHRARIHENAQIFDFALSADDMAELDALDRTGGTDHALEATWR
jgi:diketogulonate reductase-like aldo/keto reductase